MKTTASWCRTLCCALAGLAWSCVVPPEPTVADLSRSKSNAANAERGLLWMFPGIVGLEWEMGPAYRALRDAGLVRETRFFQWDRPGLEILDHLADEEHNRQRAAEVAAEIVAWRGEHPDAPIDLVGYSGGAAIAVWVAEALPEDVRLNKIVMAQPGLSPTYDLRDALSRVDDRMIVFYSPGDWLLAGAFTSLLGTLDRRFTAAAGKDGFWLEVAVPDPVLRAKVEQVGWTPEWAAAGHPGTHLPILQYEWNRRIVAPYLVDEDESAPLSALDWLVNWLPWHTVAPPGPGAAEASNTP